MSEETERYTNDVEVKNLREEKKEMDEHHHVENQRNCTQPSGGVGFFFKVAALLSHRDDGVGGHKGVWGLGSGVRSVAMATVVTGGSGNTNDKHQ